MSGQVSSTYGSLSGTGTDKTLHSGGSNNMFPTLLRSRQVWHVVCQRVRRVHPFLFAECCFWSFFGFLVSSWCLVHMESASFARLPVVYKAWVSSVCLLLDTPFGRRSVGALPL